MIAAATATHLNPNISLFFSGKISSLNCRIFTMQKFAQNISGFLSKHQKNNGKMCEAKLNARRKPGAILL